jgi:hypothetical protein
VQAVSAEGLDGRVGQIVRPTCAHELLGEIGAEHALVVGCQGDGNPSGKVVQKGMRSPCDVEDDVITCQTHFHTDILGSHAAEESARVVLVSHIYTVPDSLGARNADCRPHVIAQVLGRNGA